MLHILIVALLATLIACAKREVPQENLVERQGAAYKVNPGKLRAAEETPLKESSEFTYIGLTVKQAQVAAVGRNERFRVVKRDGVDLPVTFDFVDGRINAEVVNGVVVGVSVEGSSKQ